VKDGLLRYPASFFVLGVSLLVACTAGGIGFARRFDAPWMVDAGILLGIVVVAAATWRRRRLDDAARGSSCRRPAAIACMAAILAVIFLPASRLSLRASFRAKDSVASVAFSPDGLLLVSGSGFDDNVIEIWDIPSGKNRATISGHDRFVHDVVFSPDGKRIASASRDKTVKLWDVGTARCLMTFDGHTDEVYSVAFSGDGTTLASGSWDHTVRIWDVATGQVKHVLTWQTQYGKLPAGLERASDFVDHVNFVAFSPAGTIVAAACGDAAVRLWRTGDGANVATLSGHTWCVDSVAYAPDGNRLASGSSGVIKIWDPSTGQAVATLEAHDDRVASLAFSPDGTRLVSGSWDRTVKLWDVATGKNLTSVTGDRKHVYTVAVKNDGTSVASGGFHGEIKLWDVRPDE
jgi:WD40 repeat protein